jgi:hypothetical protein
MNQAQAVVIVAAELRLFLRPGRRGGPVAVAVDGTSSLGHVVESLGVPLTEAGRLLVNGEPAAPGYRPRNSDVVMVEAVRRPQQLTSARFVLDVHLGTLARRLRLAGVDTTYASDAGDDALIEQANAGRRVLLTQDRGLLRRRALWLGAYVRGARPDDQLRDVLDRFRPPLDPVPGLQRAAVPGRQGSRGSHAAARHPPHLPGILQLPHLRPGVLARRPWQAPRADHRLSSPRRQSLRKPVRAHSGMTGCWRFT